MELFRTVAAVEVHVGAGRAVLLSHVNLGVKVLRYSGVALLARGLLGVEGHFGTFNDDIVDLVLFPPARKRGTRSQKKKMASRLQSHLPGHGYLVGSSSWSLVPVTSSG